MKLYRLITLLTCCFFSIQVFSQELKSKFELKTESYSYNDYKGHPQIMAITQDNHGVMYFANQFGIALYNGGEWSTINLLGSSVRSLACDNNGIVYVGGIDFGCLEVQKNGKRKFKSFKSLIPDSLNFGLIEHIDVTNEGLVFFKSSDFIFIYDRDSVSIIEKENNFKFHSTYVINDEFYVFIKNYGFKKYFSSSLKLNTTT